MTDQPISPKDTATTQQATQSDLLPDLLDVQEFEDTRGVALQQVGVSHIEFPMTVLQKDGKHQHVAAKANLTVGLQAERKGAHFSRFVELLNSWCRHEVFTLDLQAFLTELKAKQQATSATIDIGFQYFMEKAAPVSGLTAPMAYTCRFKGQLTETNQYRFVLGVQIYASTLCPCSKAISKYGAHNQRAEIEVKLNLSPDSEQPMLWIEDVISILENSASCPVYPMLKRVDEKWVTERQYENAKFVEDVLRDSVLALRNAPRVEGFSIRVEALESIHAHNAYAAHQEHFKDIT